MARANSSLRAGRGAPGTGMSTYLYIHMYVHMYECTYVLCRLSRAFPWPLFSCVTVCGPAASSLAFFHLHSNFPTISMTASTASFSPSFPLYALLAVKFQSCHSGNFHLISTSSLLLPSNPSHPSLLFPSLHFPLTARPATLQESTINFRLLSMPVAVRPAALVSCAPIGLYQ